MGREGHRSRLRHRTGTHHAAGVASIEDDGKGRQTIAITELPYQVKKSQLIESISDLVRERKLEGIAALRDESDRAGMRIAIELKRDAEPAQDCSRILYHKTKLEVTFGINMLGLVEGRPHQLSLKRSLNLFIEHRKAVITARTQFDLDEASSRLHVLEGLNKALGALDTVIALIRAAQSTDAAQKALVEQLWRSRPPRPAPSSICGWRGSPRWNARKSPMSYARCSARCASWRQFSPRHGAS